MSGIDAVFAMFLFVEEKLFGADLRVGDIARLPWADNAFDVATVFNVVQFTDDILATIAELVRVAPQVAICNWGTFSDFLPVFAALRVNRTVIPDGMLTVVKLKRPVAGRASVVFVVGLNAPSAPVLELLNVCACAGPVVAAKAPHSAIATVVR